MTGPSWATNGTLFGGELAQDTISFGGVITSENTSFSMSILRFYFK